MVASLSNLAIISLLKTVFTCSLYCSIVSNSLIFSAKETFAFETVTGSWMLSAHDEKPLVNDIPPIILLIIRYNLFDKAFFAFKFMV